jgi:hypothetical protein
MVSRRLVAYLFSFALTSSVVWAQAVSTSEISGTVKDESGAILPGVEITATQTDTGIQRTAITNETGSYALPSLPVGPYRLEAALAGFRTYAQTGIVLQVGTNPVIPIVLSVGQVSERIEVTADAALVETRTTGIGSAMENQRILELPLNGRQVSDLVLLSGMATPGYTNSLNGGNKNYPTTGISIAGGQATGTIYLLDGGMHNDVYNNYNLPLPFPDALQEFKVESTALPAQYGNHSSAAVNAVTKSGTNTLHGSGFEFFRDGKLNARNTFALSRDSLRRNQTGGTLGGPIVHDKLFFFGGYQGTFIHSAPTDTLATIPTTQMLTGDFTAFTSPACNGNRQINLGAPFVGNKVSPSQFSFLALNVMSKLPQTSDPCGLIRFGRLNSSTEHIVVGRVDYQKSAKQSLLWRYEQARLDSPTDFDAQNVLALFNGTRNQRVHSFVVGDTYVIGSGIVSNFRATFDRSINERHNPNLFDWSDLGVNVYSPVPHFFFATFGSFSISSTNASPSYFNSTSYHTSEDLSLIKGKHQFGFGANFIYGQLNYRSLVSSFGSYTFNGQVTGNSLADFMVGKPTQWGQGANSVHYNRQDTFGMYFQDTWKATSRLTVNAGIRWDPNLPMWEKRGHLVSFIKSRFDAGLHSSVYPLQPAGLLFPGDPGYPGNSVWNAQLGHFAPRVGLAWDPKADGRTVIRAAYGILYDYPALFQYFGIAQNAPFGNQVIVPFPTNLANPWQDYPGGNPLPRIFDKNLAPVANARVTSAPLNMKAPYINQFNFSIQKQLGEDWLLSANYAGNATVHLGISRELNPVIYMPGSSCVINGKTYSPCSSTGNTPQRRLLYLQNPDQGQYFESISSFDDSGTGSFNALLLSVQRRQSKGVTLQGNYTWAHCIQDLVSVFPGSTTGNYLMPNNRRFDRGNCDTNDRRHVAHISAVYQTPHFSNDLVRKLAGNWQISGIARLSSGAFFSASTGVDTSLTSPLLTGQRPNQVLASVYSPTKTQDHWLNPAAFLVPATGTFGNMGFGSIRGPGNVTIDAALSRTFKIREGQNLQFRWEAFNAPNRVNLNNPTATLNSPLFGRITTAGDPRIMQAALKYIF